MRPSTLHTVFVWLAGLGAALGWLALAVATAAPPVRSVDRLDVQRYAGTWHEIARLAGTALPGCASDVTASYWPVDARSMRVVRECRDAREQRTLSVADAVAEGEAGTARFTLSRLPAWLRWWPRSAEAHWVVMLDPDYRWAVVSDPARRTLAILSRTPSLAPALHRQVIESLRAQRYPVDRLVPTLQHDRLLPTAARARVTA